MSLVELIDYRARLLLSQRVDPCLIAKAKFPNALFLLLGSITFVRLAVRKVDLNLDLSGHCLLPNRLDGSG